MPAATVGAPRLLGLVFADRKANPPNRKTLPGGRQTPARPQRFGKLTVAARLVGHPSSPLRMTLHRLTEKGGPRPSQNLLPCPSRSGETVPRTQVVRLPKAPSSGRDRGRPQDKRAADYSSSSDTSTAILNMRGTASSPGQEKPRENADRRGGAKRGEKQLSTWEPTRTGDAEYGVIGRVRLISGPRAVVPRAC